MSDNRNAVERWYFTKQELENAPSRRFGIELERELRYRQQCANVIQHAGQRLAVSQLCINTAIVYLHRFYMYHSMNLVNRNHIALSALYLACKVEEQPRKLEDVAKVGYFCIHKVRLEANSDAFKDQIGSVLEHENILLLTLGFDVVVEHPHAHIVRCCRLMKLNQELSRTAYFMATDTLHLTTMCIRYKPTVVACFCINAAIQNSGQVFETDEGLPWYHHIDPTVTLKQLKSMKQEFLSSFYESPRKHMRRMMTLAQTMRNSRGKRTKECLLSSFPNVNDHQTEHRKLNVHPASSTATSSTLDHRMEQKSETKLNNSLNVEDDKMPYLLSTFNSSNFSTRPDISALLNFAASFNMQDESSTSNNEPRPNSPEMVGTLAKRRRESSMVMLPDPKRSNNFVMDATACWVQSQQTSFSSNFHNPSVESPVNLSSAQPKDDSSCSSQSTAPQSSEPEISSGCVSVMQSSESSAVSSAYESIASESSENEETHQ